MVLPRGERGGVVLPRGEGAVWLRGDGVVWPRGGGVDWSVSVARRRSCLTPRKRSGLASRRWGGLTPKRRRSCLGWFWREEEKEMADLEEKEMADPKEEEKERHVTNIFRCGAVTDVGFVERESGGGFRDAFGVWVHMGGLVYVRELRSSLRLRSRLVMVSFWFSPSAGVQELVCGPSCCGSKHPSTPVIRGALSERTAPMHRARKSQHWYPMGMMCGDSQVAKARRGLLSDARASGRPSATARRRTTLEKCTCP